MRTESTVKAEMVRKARLSSWYARRFEDQYAVGIPDLTLIPVGGPVYWIEMKLLKGTTFGPTPRQAEELVRLSKTDVVVALVGGYNVAGNRIAFYRWKGEPEFTYNWVDFKFFLGAIKEHQIR